MASVKCKYCEYTGDSRVVRKHELVIHIQEQLMVGESFRLGSNYHNVYHIGAHLRTAKCNSSCVKVSAVLFDIDGVDYLVPRQTLEQYNLAKLMEWAD